ncbi:hypothetical protein DEO72_LG1g2577 [Vigna unguiculata]|uniref:Uncharacterized protein n=1 Tax=Vigna unguiculata TaxID=3917 RepID=A0A4D6KWS2_VIGUN|nr:hypothetical protein DEO72_LG1g2577 [Vigna unguiculata]
MKTRRIRLKNTHPRDSKVWVTSARVWTSTIFKLAQPRSLSHLLDLFLELLCSLFGVEVSLTSLFQWRKSDNLTQACRSHLSESIRKPSQVLHELQLRRRAPVLSEQPSRSVEEVSPKQENATMPLFPFLSSRLGERSPPERETPLA